MSTIKDVARLAKVSPAIVSRIINEDDTLSIRKETEERVRAAIKQLGYRPNLMARALRVKETKVIAMVIADISNPYFPELVKGAQRAATQRDFILTLFDTEEDIENERKYIEVISDRQMDGIILTSVYVEDETLRIVDNAGMPYALIQRMADYKNGLGVKVDDVRGSSMAVQHLIDYGHKKIGNISGLSYTDPGRNRLKGYKETLKKNGIDMVPGYIVEADFTEAGGYTAMKKILELASPPSAVVVGNDLMALGAMEAVKDSGLSIPDDISIVGFDDIWVARKTNPSLTTVRADLYNMGYIACKLLIQKILGERIENENIMIDVELVVRESTKAIQ